MRDGISVRIPIPEDPRQVRAVAKLYLGHRLPPRRLDHPRAVVTRIARGRLAPEALRAALWPVLLELADRLGLRLGDWPDVFDLAQESPPAPPEGMHPADAAVRRRVVAVRIAITHGAAPAAAGER